MRIDDPESNRRKGPGGPPQIFCHAKGPRRAQGQHPANTTPQHGSWRPVYFVSDAGGGWNVRVRLQAKAGGAMGCAIATTLGMMLQTARQLSEMAFGSIFVSALAVMESL